MTEEEKRLAAVRHMVHDYTNLVSAGTLIHQSPKPPLNSHVQYSFIVQCRKFADFFSNRVSRLGKDDMMAKHFVGSKVRFTSKEWKKWEDHMNAHLFHLSYKRVKNTRPWTGYGVNQAILDEFRADWRLFLSKLPEPYKSKFREEIKGRQAPDANGRPSEFKDLDLS
jgi:hypothetical protein